MYQIQIFEIWLETDVSGYLLAYLVRTGTWAG